jgi:hypothetical protein
MMTKSILWMAVLVPSALTADPSNENLHAWYADGTCVEFYSESTGSTTPTSTSGSVIVDNTNTVHRVVKDARGNVLFAYDVVARRAAGLKDTFAVQSGRAYRGMARTVSAVRDFPAVKLGEAVKVDILQNPATGGRSTTSCVPRTTPASFPPTAVGDEFVLGDMQIVIDGEKFQWATGATTSGAAAASTSRPRRVLPLGHRYPGLSRSGPRQSREAYLSVGSRTRRNYTAEKCVEQIGVSRSLGKTRR